MKKLILLLMLLPVVACERSVDKGSVLDRSSCSLPCWNGVVAGKTSEAEFMRILTNQPDINPQSIRKTDRPWNIFDNQIYFSFRQGWTLSQKAKLRGEASITNDTVSDLILCGETKVSMGQLVAAIGEPEGIISGNNFYGGRTVILVNPQSGISYWYTASLDNLEITPDTPIGCIKIFNPALYEKMLDAKLFSGGYYDAEETLRAMYPWGGYGNLDEKYPPR